MMTAIFKRFRDCEAGISSVEYALLATILGIGLLASVSLLGNDVSKGYDNIGEEVATQTEQGVTANY